MSASDVEEEVFERIGELSLEKLLSVYNECSLPGIEERKKTKPTILKAILKYLSSDAVEKSEDAGLSKFLWIQSLMNSDKVEPPSSLPIKAEDDGPASELHHLRTVLKKDFKIRGMIGVPGQKDRLTFSSLAYQMDTGEKKNYSDTEICEEVIRAISPDIPLRCFLEGKTDLTLDKLRKILRAHFHEPDPTTLFNTLSNSVQQNNESPSDFVVRLMNLRQKVLFVSKEMDTRFQYTESLVQNQFLHSVETGLRNDNIRNEVKQLLKSTISDEELLENLNKVVSDENERQSKMKKNVHVSWVEAEDISKKDIAHSKEKKENPILLELRELKVQLNEVTAMKSDIEDLKKQINSRDKDGPKYRRKFGCPTCIKNNVPRCRHCYLCGSSDHFRSNCDNQGN